jgi:hypothetical protein
MKNYSIVRIGNDYIVQADDQSVLKIASRRRAAKLITDAAELLDSHPPPGAQAEPSIACDPGITLDPGIIVEPEVMLDAKVILDPEVILDPSEVS